MRRHNYQIIACYRDVSSRVSDDHHRDRVIKNQEHRKDRASLLEKVLKI